jgi:pyruvate,water dikinase
LNVKRNPDTSPAAFYPKPVIVRMSDFKTNEYARLLGGEEFEPKEENPMIGFRGATRYCDPRYSPGFALECMALMRVRNKMWLTNLKVLFPFCRTVNERKKVIAQMALNGLRQGENGLKVLPCAKSQPTSSWLTNSRKSLTGTPSARTI